MTSYRPRNHLASWREPHEPPGEAAAFLGVPLGGCGRPGKDALRRATTWAQVLFQKGGTLPATGGDPIHATVSNIGQGPNSLFIKKKKSQ